jgi:hypothetical protein
MSRCQRAERLLRPGHTSKYNRGSACSRKQLARFLSPFTKNHLPTSEAPRKVEDGAHAAKRALREVRQEGCAKKSRP